MQEHSAAVLTGSAFMAVTANQNKTSSEVKGNKIPKK
jgi:hypothetical protein